MPPRRVQKRRSSLEQEYKENVHPFGASKWTKPKTHSAPSAIARFQARKPNRGGDLRDLQAEEKAWKKYQEFARTGAGPAQ